MPFEIEVQIDQAVEGPRHGELVNLIHDAIDQRAPGYVTKVRVSWRDRPLTCPHCGSEAYLCTSEHTDGPGARIHCRAASLHNFAVPADCARKDS